MREKKNEILNKLKKWGKEINLERGRKSGMVVHFCHPHTLEASAGELPQA